MHELWSLPNGRAHAGYHQAKQTFFQICQYVKCNESSTHQTLSHLLCLPLYATAISHPLQLQQQLTSCCVVMAPHICRHCLSAQPASSIPAFPNTSVLTSEWCWNINNNNTNKITNNREQSANKLPCSRCTCTQGSYRQQVVLLQVLSPGRGEQIKGDFAAAAKVGEVNLQANSTAHLAGC